MWQKISMKTHEQIDQRSLLMTQAIVARIDQDPDRSGLTKAREVCRRWEAKRSEPIIREWSEILHHPWEDIRRILLDDSEESRRLRQSSPFCGILTPQERWKIYRMFDSHETN